MQGLQALREYGTSCLPMHEVACLCAWHFKALCNKLRKVVMAGLLPQQVLRSTLRSVGCPVCCLPPRLLRLQVGPLPSLRTIVRRPLSTVTVRAQRSGLAEGKRAALAARFAELGLGQDLLTFLAESRLGSPTEIQVRRCTALLGLCSARLAHPYTLCPLVLQILQACSAALLRTIKITRLGRGDSKLRVRGN